MSDNTKPFEIRTNLLHLAREILSENAHQQMIESTPDTGGPGKWTPYTTEQVLTEAEKLYAFVSTR